MKQECRICAAERASRALVCCTAEDPRFHLPKFLAAPAIFPNNDIKYDINKLRAQLYATLSAETVTWVHAKDTPSQDALREKPGLVSQKLEWLSRHDRECGDLYGMLPLIHGMPVALTDHIDRSNDKKLLRGKIGYVHSWVLDDQEASEFEGSTRILIHLPVDVDT